MRFGKRRHQLKFHRRVHPYISMRERAISAGWCRRYKVKDVSSRDEGQEGPICSRKKDHRDCGAAD